MPITQWLPAYPRDWLRPDLTAGLTSWGVMVPVALAYASLAGVPPEIGLVTAFTALAAYAVFGTSRHLKVTVSSTMAVMSAAVIADLARGHPGTYLALTAALALTVGVILLAAGFARLGFVSDFLSKPVVTGFIFGLAITVVVGQLPKILGVPGVSGTLPEQIGQLLGSLGEVNPYTVAVGGAALALILVLRASRGEFPGRSSHSCSGSLRSRCSTSRATASRSSARSRPASRSRRSRACRWHRCRSSSSGRGDRVHRHGRVHRGGPPVRRATRLRDRRGPGAAGAGVGQPRVGAVRRVRHGRQPVPDRHGEAAGARSQLSSLVTSGLILATAIFLAPLFANLPDAVLGAIVIAAVLGLMDVMELRRYWAWRRTDFLLAVIALVGVLLTTVLVGMVIAVVLSVTFLLYRASRPYVASVGRLPGHRAGFGDLSRHDDAEPIEGLLIVRLDAPLYYFNANVARSQILELVDADGRRRGRCSSTSRPPQTST